jgi:hypothetical protein
VENIRRLLERQDIDMESAVRDALSGIVYLLLF